MARQAPGLDVSFTVVSREVAGRVAPEETRGGLALIEARLHDEEALARGRQRATAVPVVPRQ